MSLGSNPEVKEQYVDPIEKEKKEKVAVHIGCLSLTIGFNGKNYILLSKKIKSHDSHLKLGRNIQLV